MKLKDGDTKFGLPVEKWLMTPGYAQSHIRDLHERIDACHAIIAQQDAELRARANALKPFAQAADDCGVADDMRIGVVKPADIIWESAVAASITFGHVAYAAEVLESSKAVLADANSNHSGETP